MTKYLLRPFVTVEIDDDGRMKVDYDDCDALIGRMTGADDQYEDFDGGDDWTPVEIAYRRWARDIGLVSDGADELVSDELDQAIVDAGLDARVGTFGDQPVMQSATPVVEPRPKGPSGQGN